MTTEPKTTLQLTQDALDALTKACAQFNKYHIAIGFDKDAYWKLQHFNSAIRTLNYLLEASQPTNGETP